MSEQTLMIIGCGILGRLVSHSWVGSSIGIVRSEVSVQRLIGEGIEGTTQFPTDLTNQNVLFCTNGSPNQIEVIKQFILSNQSFVGKAILISSTSFYQGIMGPINESSASGSTSRAIQCKLAEDIFRQHFHSGWILRCGGLFQPGRGPFSYLSQTRQIPPMPLGHELALFSYRDLARLVVFLLNSSSEKLTTILCTLSDCPTRFQFYRAACAKLEIPFEIPEISMIGPNYQPTRLLSFFDLEDKHWSAALE